jgi:putative peptidoglycan lipid II flippase
MGVTGLAWGTVLGSALHLGIQLPGLLRLKPRYAPILTLTHPGVREVLRLMAPRVLGLAIVQLNFWVELFLASGMVEGSISALRRAFFVLLLPLGIIGQSVGIAVFPTFSAHVASDDHAALQRTLGQVLRAVLFLSIPATVGLVVLRLPVIRAIYEYGEFTFTDSQAVAWALLFYGLGLVSHSLLEIVTRVFYALHDTRTPVYVGGGAMILNIVFSLILMRVMGDPGSLTMGPFAGLALANTLATTLEIGTLIALLRPRVGGLDARRLLAGTLRAGIAAAVMGAILYAALPTIDRVGIIPGLIGAMALGGAIYWGLAWIIGSEDARMFTAMTVARIRRGASQPTP